ncbi:MAG: DUF4129 domain-containing protein [Ethanoligenens sp.]
MKAILQRKIILYVLSLAAAVTGCMNLFVAFAVPKGMASDFWSLLGMSALTMAVLTGLFWNKRLSVISLCAIAALTVSLAIFSHSSNWFATHNTQWKLVLYYFLIIAVCAIVFAAMQTRGTLALLFLLGVGEFFLLSVLEYRRYAVCLVIFSASVAVLYIVRTSFSGPGKGRRIGKGAQLSVSVFSLAACTVALLISVSVFHFMIQPLHPKTQDFVLLTNTAVLQMAKHTGAVTPNDAQTASLYYQQTLTSSAASAVSSTPSQSPSVSNDSGGGENKETSHSSGKPHRINYFPHIPWALIILSSAVAVIVLAYLLKWWMRCEWHERAFASDKSRQIVLLYGYFAKTFAHVGYKLQRADTPIEYANRVGNSVSAFDKTIFYALTEIFMKVRYGDKKVSDTEYQLYRNFDSQLQKYARKEIGTFQSLARYLFI